MASVNLYCSFLASSRLHFKRDGRAGPGASSISGEGDVLSYPNDNIVSGQDKFVNQSPGECLDNVIMDLEKSSSFADAIALSILKTYLHGAKHGTSTGVSAHDRATATVALASKDSKPEDFNRPGHIFPLKYREAGVLKRAGHTEASVDLAMLAGLEPVAVLCEIVDDDGSMARLPRLRQFAQAENLKIISIADLIRYRRRRDRLVELAAAAPIPTMWGAFKAYCYRSLLDGIEHVAMVKGEIGGGKDILVRIHSECHTGDIFGSARCDCGNQLALAMKQMEEAGRGVLLYIRGHEGRGLGLGHKSSLLITFKLMDEIQLKPTRIWVYLSILANMALVQSCLISSSLCSPVLVYLSLYHMLRDLGVRTMKLMTNNPAKYVGLKGYGLAVGGRVPLLTPITMEN
ncbi:hypothetical protein Peur_012791 [Populus x canadensis]